MNKQDKLKLFGNNLRAERNRQNLSQEELGARAGIQLNHISRIENGQTDIKLSTLISLLEALNLKFEKLYETE